ncbi:Protein of unknown function [Rhizobiales bacterium GAS113]|nr:Protein of unknown function [Rhizobiales bacterium GAS113]
MAIYKLGDGLIDTGAPDTRASLAAAHGAKARPLCVCRSPGVEMYVAKSSGGYVVKRMPNTGGDHEADCDSFEPPPELSGLGAVLGSAIEESPNDGVTTLKLGFSLSRAGTRMTPASGAADKPSATTAGSRLTQRGLLHFLWEEARLNRWWPAMEGRRGWGVVRRELLGAAENKEAKGGALANSLYIPEPFVVEKADELRGRRDTLLASVKRPPKGPRPLMMVIAEVKAMSPARYGYKIAFKHLPDFPFMLDEELHKAVRKRFAAELDLNSAVEDSHLVAIGTFGLAVSGLAVLEEISLQVMTVNWLPFETMQEKQLLDAMTAQGRRFIKGLRYNLSALAPLASVVALDTVPRATAMYVVSPGASQEYCASLDALIAQSRFASWRWDVESAAMPALPAATRPALPPPVRALPDLRREAR